MRRSIGVNSRIITSSEYTSSSFSFLVFFSVFLQNRVSSIGSNCTHDLHRREELTWQEEEEEEEES